MPQGNEKTVLIVGVNGFVGSHLAEACIKIGLEVYGTIRGHRSALDNISHVQDIRLYACDITDNMAVADVVKNIKPDYLFHLAAQSYVPESWKAPSTTLITNINGTLNVLEAIRRYSPKTRFVVAGTSEEYGMVYPSETPITEDQPFRPLSPYGVSKVACDLLTRQYVASYKLQGMVARPFNTEGPRRGEAFAPSNWAKQVAEIEAGLREPIIKHGNLSAIRDITDVRDIVKGYIAIAEKGKSGEVYQLCSCRHRTMEEIIDLITYDAKTPIALALDKTRLRPSDVPRLIGNYNKARKELGWIPKIELETTMTDLLNYWREKISKDLTNTKRVC